MALRLDIEEDGQRRAVPFAGSELTIGRGADNAVVINDPRSSRHHCRLVRTPQGLLLEDMDSRNGTILNGSPVKKILVQPGAQFLVGNVRFHICDEENGSSQDDTAIQEARGPAPPISRSRAVQATTTRQVEKPAPVAKPAAAAQPPATVPPATVPPATVPPATVQVRAAAALVEVLDGPAAGDRLELRSTPFVIGRSKDCDLVIEDKRASGRHAEIVLEGGAYYVRDLESTNGTSLGSKPVKGRALLTTGAVIVIGSTRIRARVPRSARGAGGEAGADAGAGDEFVRFDVEKFLERDRAQHPLAVGALVAIVLVVAYFTVDTTRRLSRHEELDPPAESNLLGRNWSFEDAAGGAAAMPGKAPAGWRLADGDQGSIERSPAHAQLPGKQALTLRSGGDRDLVRATCENDLILGNERRYRLEGYALHEGGFAAGLLVEWLRPGKDGVVLVGRSYSDAARAAGEAVDVDQIVLAPQGATLARVSCFVLGENAAGAFDRISFSIAKEADGAASKALHGGPREEPIAVSLAPDGTFSVARRKRVLLPALWAGLPPEADPMSLGPRLAAIRPEAGGEAVAFDVEVPDEKEGRWTTLETRAAVSGETIHFQWRAATAAGEAPKAVTIYVETRETGVPIEALAGEGAAGSAVPAHGAAVNGAAASGAAASGAAAPLTARELVLGEKDEKVTIAFTEPVKLSTVPHPYEPGRVLLAAEGAGGGVDFSLTHGSARGASLARALALEAEEAFRAGRAGAAIDLLSKMKDRFPDEKVDVSRAEARAEEWKGLARSELKSLEAELVFFRATPTPVIQKVLLERASNVAERYSGTEEGARAAQLVAEVKGILGAIEKRQEDEDLKALHELARKSLASNELGLAELYFRWVIAADKEGSLRREAENALKSIEGKRALERKILLQ